MKAVACDLVETEKQSKLRASMIALRASVPNAEATELLVKIAAVEPLSLDTPAATNAVAALKVTGVVEPSPEHARINAIADELRTYLNFLALVLRCGRGMGTSDGYYEAMGNGKVEALARVRQGLEANPAVAEARLSEARKLLAA
ncbi:MAG TPA: hypothetical protein VFR28_03035 [Allosphingosinicella sp.]|nr:hypothetical protein [Allosphingosinicella sp.]